MREFELLQHVYESSRSLGDAVLIPPGDDMAMVELDTPRLLAAVDQVVDGVHVKLEATPIEAVGRKAITRCLSDIAAMAARPVASMAAVVLPTEFDEDVTNRLFDSMRETAEQFDCPLIGGDIAMYRKKQLPLVCSVTALATPAGGRVLQRCGAHVGDSVYVTGELGGAVAEDGSGRHLAFEPRIRPALELLDRLGDRLHAMIDISDGLGRDAGHIAEQSDVCIELWAEDIPCTPGCEWQRAIGDGEDYELCFTAVGEVPDTLGSLPVTRIGQVVEMTRHASERPEGRVWIRVAGKWQRADELGWEHES